MSLMMKQTFLGRVSHVPPNDSFASSFRVWPHISSPITYTSALISLFLLTLSFSISLLCHSHSHFSLSPPFIAVFLPATPILTSLSSLYLSLSPSFSATPILTSLSSLYCSVSLPPCHSHSHFSLLTLSLSPSSATPILTSLSPSLPSVLFSLSASFCPISCQCACNRMTFLKQGFI